jgi:tRNA/tmRNA/rRNA uracil-C5-methylase (TrmA/RlmC/RlmD family)
VTDLLELEVGPVANGGWCVARHEGRVVFVRHALPGETVRAQVTEETTKFLRADAVEILTPSADRVKPPCVFAGPGRCGGCDWQHATLEAQRRLKAAVVEEQLQRVAGITRSVTVEELPGTVDGLGWRTRVQFAVRGDGAIGLRRQRSHQIEPIDACLIAHPDVEAAGAETKRWPGATTVEITASAGTGDRLVVVEGRGGRDRRPVKVPRLDAPVRVVRGKPVAGEGLPFVREDVAGRLWQVSGGGFWQVHPSAAQTLADAVVDALDPQPGETAIDLYCGAGLFAGVLAERIGSNGLVVGIESDQIAVHDARHNLRDLPHVVIERGRVESVFDRLEMHRADLVVLDPPRAGAGREVVELIAGLAGRAVGYVSCDPATLARDLGFFATHGWRLSDLRAFDAFPMTHHVECLATLTKA